MADIQDQKNRIDGDARIIKENADAEAVKQRQAAADQEAARIRADAEAEAQAIENNAQN